MATPRAYLSMSICTSALSSPLTCMYRIKNGCTEQGLVRLMRVRWCLMSEMCCCSLRVGKLGMHVVLRDVGMTRPRTGSA
jgi:hypothetical protein